MRSATESYYINSKVTGKDAVISETQHPLVALYSVPPCKFVQKVRVHFRPAEGCPWQSSPYKMCQGHRTTNFLVAGMKPETEYETHHEVVFGWMRHKNSPTQDLKTGSIERPPIPANVFEVSHGLETGTSLSDSVILHALLFGATQQQLWINAPVATDLEGNVIWYYKEPALLPNAGSFMMSFPPSVSGTFLIPMARPPALQAGRVYG